MRQKISQVVKHPFFSGSLIMLIGSNVANVLNYIYHPLMARLLGVTGYGELASLISVLGLLLMLPTSLGLVITKFVSSSNVETDRVALINWLNRRLLWVGLILLLGTWLISVPIANFLKLSSSWSVLMLGVIFLLYLPLMVVRASLQGLLKFKQLVASLMTENTIKIGLGVVLVSIGLGVNGALIGIVFASLVTYLIFRSQLRFKGVIPSQGVVEPRQLVMFAVPVLAQSLSVASFYSTDLILVKHFFSGEQAGVYAALSIMSRIIFFGASPIAAVSFPMISRKYASHEPIDRLLGLSLVAVALICLLVVGLFWWFPQTIISLPYGNKYLSGAGLLALFGISTSFLAFCHLLTSFFLAIGKVRIIGGLVLAALIQAVGIWFFHASLDQVIWITVWTTGVLLLTLSTYAYLLIRRG